MTSFYKASDGVDEILKDPAAELPYALHWYDWLRGSDGYWAPRIFVQPGEIYTPPRAALNGYRYRCVVGGQTGARAPAWPTSGADAFTDGGATWVLVGEEDTLASVTVTADSGLTAANDAVDATGTMTTVDLSGGTAGTSYTVTFAVVTDQGKEDERSFRVKVEQR